MRSALQALQICDELDGNGDGTISLYELCEAYNVPMPLIKAADFDQVGQHECRYLRCSSRG